MKKISQLHLQLTTAIDKLTNPSEIRHLFESLAAQLAMAWFDIVVIDLMLNRICNSVAANLAGMKLIAIGKSLIKFSGTQ